MVAFKDTLWAIVQRRPQCFAPGKTPGRGRTGSPKGTKVKSTAHRRDERTGVM